MIIRYGRLPKKNAYKTDGITENRYNRLRWII